MCCAVVIFALGLFAASPVLHEQLHHHAQPMADDGCAIVMFAGGALVPVAVTAVPPPRALSYEQRDIRSAEIFLSSPHYRLQPECGPPIC
jgi:uncharacterized membrane protein YgdD (TMEM256/DUF423 family)